MWIRLGRIRSACLFPVVVALLLAGSDLAPAAESEVIEAMAGHDQMTCEELFGTEPRIK